MNSNRWNQYRFAWNSYNVWKHIAWCHTMAIDVTMKYLPHIHFTWIARDQELFEKAPWPYYPNNWNSYSWKECMYFGTGSRYQSEGGRWPMHECIGSRLETTGMKITGMKIILDNQWPIEAGIRANFSKANIIHSLESPKHLLRRLIECRI